MRFEDILHFWLIRCFSEILAENSLAQMTNEGQSQWPNRLTLVMEIAVFPELLYK